MPQGFDIDFRAAILRGALDGMDEGYDFAIRRSSGTRSTAELSRKPLDHPFARRHGAPKLDPGEINVQSGRFKGAWQRPEVTRFGDEIGARILNDSDVADWLRDGNRTTFPRPIGEETERHAATATERIIETELRKWASANH